MSVGSAPVPAPGLQFCLLGPLEVLRDGVALDLGAPKQRAVLAALLLADGSVVSVDRLIEAVWGDNPPSRAASGVQVYLSKLRNILQANDSQGVLLARRAPGYLLTAPWVDVAEFRRLSDRATESARVRSWAEAVAAAAAAVGLWRGPFLDDLADEPWVAAEAARLDEIYAQCMQAWVTGLLGAGSVGEAITRSQTMIEAYPLQEHCWWLRMIALYRGGRTPEALDAYQHFAGELGEQLGLEPGPELRNLQTAILRHDEAFLSWPKGPGAEQTAADGPAALRPTVSTDPATPKSDTAAPALGREHADIPAIVGRDEQLAVLDNVLGDIVGGRHHWVLLTGRAGMGKTRLATEIVARARRRGIRTVWTSCPDDRGTPAWWPLRALVAGLGSDPDEVFLPPSGVDADTVRFTVYERFSQLLQQTPTGAPLLAVIDDAQWLDAASVRCLGYLVRTQRLTGVGIILTVRDREHRPDFAEVLTAIGRDRVCVHLPLEALDGPSASMLLHQVGGDTVSAADAFALIRRVGGNPLLLTEYARLPPGERREGHIPLAARGLLERRLRQLPEDVLAVVGAAGVIGETFELDLLADVSGLDLIALVDRLDVAAVDAIIEPAISGTGYQFRHGLLRDAVLAQLTVLRRQALHARIAESLAGRGVDSRTLIRRAQHLAAAMPIVGPRVVVQASAVAARSAENAWDWDAAGQQWETALNAVEVVPDADPAERDNLLVGRLTALARAGRAQTVLDTVLTALDAAATEGQTITIGRLAALLLRTSGAWPWPAYGADPSALLTGLDGLAATVTDDPAAHARVLAALAVGNCYHPDPEVPDRQSRAALAIAERLGDPDVLADAIIGRVLTYAGVAGHADETIEQLGRLSGLHRPSQGTDEVLRHNLLTMARFSRGEVAAATDHLRAGILGSDRLRLPVTRVQLRWVEVLLAEWHGDLDRTEELLAVAYERHRQTELYNADVTFHMVTLAVLWNRGRIAESPLLAHIPEPLIWGALSAAETADKARGRECISRWLAGPSTTYWYTLSYRTWLAHATADLGIIEYAQILLDLLTPDRASIASLGQSVSVGPVSLATGRLRALLGDVEGARADLAIAQQLARDGDGATAMLRIRFAQLLLDPPSSVRSDALRGVVHDAERIGMNGVAAAALKAACA